MKVALDCELSNVGSASTSQRRRVELLSLIQKKRTETLAGRSGETARL